MEQIFDLSTIKADDVLKLIDKEDGTIYCVVASCNPESTTPFYTGETVKKAIESSVHYGIKMYEFNKHSTSWSMTLPAKSDGFFTSPSDKDYSFKIYISSLHEVKILMKESDNIKIANIFSNAIKEVSKIDSEKFINNSLQKLIAKSE